MEEIDFTKCLPHNVKVAKKISKFKKPLFCKIKINSIKTPHTHLYYNYTIYARSEKDLLKTVGGVDDTDSIPYNVKSWPKWLKVGSKTLRNWLN